MRINVIAEENEITADLSQEDIEVIQNLEVLQELEVLENIDLLEDYETIKDIEIIQSEGEVNEENND